MRKITLCILLLIFLCGCQSNIDMVTDNGTTEGDDLIAQRGGTVNLFCDEPDTLNPIATGFKSISQTMNLVYEGLFRVENDFTATPILATSFSAESGNTRYVISLNKKIRFHNGTTFNAEDVISTINNIINTDSKYSENLRNVKSYSALNDETVSFELITPQVNFINLLDFPILPSECTPWDYSRENKYFVPCGTGKFKVKSCNEDSVVLEQNEDWYGDKPYIEQVMISYTKDKSAAKYLFESMETDVITTDLYSWGDTAMNGEFSTNEYESNRLVFMGLNCKNTILRDKTVRNALYRSVDKEKLVSDVVYTHAGVTNVPVNRNAFFSNMGFDFEGYEQGKTMQMLKDSGWLDLDGDGILDKYYEDTRHSLNFNLVVNSQNDVALKIAERLVDSLKKEGVMLNVMYLDYADYIAAVGNGEYDMFVGRIDIANDCDVSFMLKSDGERNFFQYASEKMDQALYKINTSFGEHDIKTSFKQFESVFRDETPFIPLYYETDAVFSSVRIKGDVEPSRTGVFTGFGNVFVNYKN